MTIFYLSLRVYDDLGVAEPTIGHQFQPTLNINRDKLDKIIITNLKPQPQPAAIRAISMIYSSKHLNYRHS